MGAASYVHNNSHTYEKLVPRANKCIFIRYFDESKGYVMLGEQPDEIITEIESRDVVFLEGEFQENGISMTLIDFFEVDESQKGIPNLAQEDESDLLPSGSVPSSVSVPLGSGSKATLLGRSQHGNIPHHHFEIEGKIFMCAPLKADELKNYQEVMKFLTFEE